MSELQDIFIEVVDPCLNTVIDSDGRLELDLLFVPLGEESIIYKFDAPNDSTSLIYGNGFDSCGSRNIKLRDSEGNFVDDKNINFLSYQDKFEIAVQSYSGFGTVKEV